MERVIVQVQELHGSPWVQRKRNSPRVPHVSSRLSTPVLSPSSSSDSVERDGPRTPLQTPVLTVSDEAGVTNTPSEATPNATTIRPNCKRRPSHDLFECIEQSAEKRLTERQARHIFRQIVNAVACLDEQGISHRDIKDENLLIDKDLNVCFLCIPYLKTDG